MKVLIVEDDAVKYGNVRAVLEQSGVDGRDIEHVVNAAEAVALLSDRSFDMLLLDVNLPRRGGEGSQRGAGLLVIKELTEDSELNRPRYIVGLTAYEDIIEEFGRNFGEQLWSILYYREDIDLWKTQLSALVEHIKLCSASHRFSDGLTYGYDVAVVCALQSELDAILAWPTTFTELRLGFDETVYFVGKVSTGARAFTVICACAPRMGMPAASVLSTKIIMQFRPRMLVMAGICAGRAGKTEIGDIMVADPSWDYGSGKIEGTIDGPKFRPRAHQLPLDPDFAALANDVGRDVKWLAELKHSFLGSKPATELNIHVAPMASGAAVVSDESTLQEVVERQGNMLALEMEAYGVFAASVGSGRPRPRCLVAKSVCDFADQNKADDFQAYAAFTSANVVLKLLIEIFERRL